MKVLSLFDGMSCGMIAFRQLGIPVDEYHAFEIDKFAVKVSQHNFPEIIHHGDVFSGDFTKFKNFDWLIGGSPCTYWSIAQNPKNRETTPKGLGWELFQQYVRALHEAEPEYFLYENNSSMSPAIRESISETFGFEPIEINSALVSAQSRKRLYWVGKSNHDGTYSKCMIEPPADRGIIVKDIIDAGFVLNDKNGKAQTIKSQYQNSNIRNFVIYKSTYGATGIAVPVQIGKMKHSDGTISDSQADRIYSVSGKSVAIKANAGGGGAKTGLYKIDLPDGDYTVRKLTVKECMRLQTIPEWYDFSVSSNTQAYKCIGNGWTVEVIMHLISQAMQNPCFRQLELF